MNKEQYIQFLKLQNKGKVEIIEANRKANVSLTKYWQTPNLKKPWKSEYSKMNKNQKVDLLKSVDKCQKDINTIDFKELTFFEQLEYKLDHITMSWYITPIQIGDIKLSLQNGNLANHKNNIIEYDFLQVVIAHKFKTTYKFPEKAPVLELIINEEEIHPIFKDWADVSELLKYWKTVERHGAKYQYGKDVPVEIIESLYRYLLDWNQKTYG